MYRVLVFGMTENPGGVESFLVNYYRHIDRSRIQFDFLCNSYEKAAYEDELKSLGGRVFHITARSRDIKLYRKELREFFEKYSKEFDAIWVNVSSLANIDYLKMAKKYGIKKRIIHSHNSRNMDSRLRGMLHSLNRSRIGKYATDFWACSDDAAKWFYNDSLLGKAVVIHNAIDTDKLSYDSKKGSEIREKLGTEGKYVLGNVGRLHFQKNQSFAIEVFSHYVKKDREAVLVLVGQGEDEEMLKRKARELEVSDKVIFAGLQNDMQAWLSSFDLFLFPSVFEGLSIAALEAQANGLPALASYGVIPEEVRLNDNFNFMKLDNNAAEWADEIYKIKSSCSRKSREEVKAAFLEKGYDINTEASRLSGLLLR